ncbi:hypothetical protein EDB85DRAFT_2278100 [Lactarius pseudohatsudake]|nr:hypothetical protein EDB85DRAFT_2278100 [Lactarius pseudohatsudake]
MALQWVADRGVGCTEVYSTTASRNGTGNKTRGRSRPPFPDPVRDTTRKRGTTRDKGGAPLCTPAPADSRKGGAQVARAPLSSLPPFARKGGAGQEGARPPFARAMGARQVSPPLFTREQYARGTGPRPRRSRLRAREGRRRSQVRHGTGHATRDGVGEHARTAPSPLLPGTPRATPEAARRPPFPWFARGDTQTRGAGGDESGCAPHTLSAPPPFARTGGALQPGAAPPSSRVGARGQRAEAAPPPLCIRHNGKRTGGALGPRAPPPFPGSRARANVNGRRQKPPLSRGFARKGKRERAATFPHPPGSRARAKHHAEAPLGARGPGGA